MTEWSHKLWKSYFRGKQFNIKTIQVYATTTSAEEVEDERFYEDLQDLLELTLKNFFIIGTGMQK